MDGMLQPHLTGTIFRHRFFWLLLLFFGGFIFQGCSTLGGSSTFFTVRSYEDQVKSFDDNLKGKPTSLQPGYYLQDGVRQRVINESIRQIQKKEGGLETPEFSSLRREYLEYVRALIEMGEFRRAAAICDQGIQSGLAIANAKAERAKRDPGYGLATFVATDLLFNTSIEPSSENDPYLRRMALYRTYIIWFTTGDRKKSFGAFEQFLTKALQKEDRIFLHLDRGAFYSSIMGDYKKARGEYRSAFEAIEAMHILNTDMRYIYSLETSGKVADMCIKLGELDEAEKALLQGEEQRSGVLSTIGSLIARIQQSNLAVIRSRMGAVYALSRDFQKSKKYFDLAKDKITSIDVNSPDIMHQKALSTYYINYGAFHVGLQQGNYREASKLVDQGLVHTKHYFLESVQSEPNIETSYLLAAELHFLVSQGKDASAKEKAKHTEKALAQIGRALDYAESHYNRVAQSAAHTLLGQIYFANNNIPRARQEYEKSLQLSKNMPSTENWKIYYGLGKIYENQRNESAALRNYFQAIREVEGLWRGRFKDTQKQVSFIDDRLIVFEPVIRILTNQKRAGEALEFMERSKSRAFFETSVFTHENPAKRDERSGQGSAEAEKLQKVNEEAKNISEKMEETTARIREMQETIKEPSTKGSSRGIKVSGKEAKLNLEESPKPKALSKQERRKLESEMAVLNKELREDRRKLSLLLAEEGGFQKKEGYNAALIGNIRPLKIAEIQKTDLPDRASILEYFVGKDVVVGVILNKKGIHAQVLAGPNNSLEANVMTFRLVLQAGYEGYEEQGQLLYNLLIKPFEKYLSGTETLCIVPHGILHYLPFQALVTKDESRKGVPAELIRRQQSLLRTLTIAYSSESMRGVKVQDKDVTGDCVEQPETAEQKALRGDFSRVLEEIFKEKEKRGLQHKRPLFLMERYGIFYAPSMTILNVVQKIANSKRDRLFALANSLEVDIKDMNIPCNDKLKSLPGVKHEVQNVAEQFATKTVLLDESATKQMFQSGAPGSDVILLSMHGMLMRENPLKSCVFLSKDGKDNGRLTVAEIEQMSLRANIVALSACETGLVSGYMSMKNKDFLDVKFPKGDDVVGLQRAFLKSGSSTVLSTLWMVDDNATAAFMKEFFGRYRNGKDKPKAMQEASLEIMKTRFRDQKGNTYDGSHPCYWAPFVLSGNWR